MLGIIILLLVLSSIHRSSMYHHRYWGSPHMFGGFWNDPMMHGPHIGPGHGPDPFHGPHHGPHHGPMW